jgi:hypothetical protein
MKAKIIAILKLSITALFFYYIFQKIDFNHFAATLRNARLDILISGPLGRALYLHLPLAHVDAPADAHSFHWKPIRYLLHWSLF